MRINHNIAALNTYNKLSANTAATSKSLEKLSSGLKINRAGDNAAGLAISEKMRGQISGLNTASSNASDGISLIQTAEGALNETHSILQRMRELAVQSSNDTNTDADRAEIQKEIDTLTQEVDRISTDTEFNTQKLLNGEKATKVETASYTDSADAGKASAVKSTSVDGNIKTGTYSVEVTVEDAKGTPAEFTQTNKLTDVNGSVSTFKVSGATAAGSYAATIRMSGQAMTATTAGGATADVGDTSAIAVGLGLGTGSYTITATSVNSGGQDTYVLADSLGKTIATSTVATAGTTLSFNGNSLTLSAGATATGAKSTFSVVGMVKIGAADEVQAGNKASNGITVNLDTDAKSGDKFTIDVGAPTAPGTDFKGADLAVGTYKLVVSDYSADGNGTATLSIQDEAGNAVKDADGKVYEKAVTNIEVAAVEIAGISISTDSIKGNSTTEFDISLAQKVTTEIKDATGTETTGIKFEFNDTVAAGDKFTVDVDADSAMKFQIGANESQNTSLAINEMGAKSLGIENLDLTTQAGANSAITTIDAAITSVSSERAKLGAVQNRLEHTINNLGTSSENLSSAESRIRDVDMAKEMMEFTKNNILSQAAQSMLAQANQQPQGVLQLLQ